MTSSIPHQEQSGKQRSILAMLCGRFTEPAMNSFFQNDIKVFWTEFAPLVGLSTALPSKRTFLAYALTLLAAGHFYKEICTDTGPAGLQLSSALRAKLSDVTLVEAVIYFLDCLSRQAFDELRKKDHMLAKFFRRRFAACPTEEDIEETGKTLDLIKTTIEATTGWDATDLLKFRLSSYASAQIGWNHTAIFCWAIGCSITKKTIFDGDFPPLDLEVTTTLAAKIHAYATSFSHVYYDMYKNIVHDYLQAPA
jgi:hypothetical protein